MAFKLLNWFEYIAFYQWLVVTYGCVVFIIVTNL